MIPIILDNRALTLLVVGNGPATARRIQMLVDAGASDTMMVFADNPSNEVRTYAGDRLIERLPNVEDMSGASAVFIADYDDKQSAQLAQFVRGLGILVNVEDKKDYCDFHVPAIVRRGDLLCTISTGAKSPRLARRLREWLGNKFSDKWADWLSELGSAREQWKHEGASFTELAEKTDQWLEERAVLETLEEKVV